MHWLSKLFKKDIGTFLRFSVVGVVWTAINVGMDILFVSYFNLPGWFGTLLSYIILYVGRYYSYLLLRVIQPQFWKYVYSTIVFTIVIWAAKSCAIHLANIPVEYASPVIAALAFVLKYLFYKSINLLQTTDRSDS